MSANLKSSALNSSVGVKPHNLIYIHELPPSKRRELCEHCDQINVWTQMAQKMGFSECEIENIKRRSRVPGNSPTDELLKIWGGKYNHKITELFGVLYTLSIFNGMRILKDYVPHAHKLMIPISVPSISKMLQSNRCSNENSIKLHNGPSLISSGVDTASIRTIATSDNNVNIRNNYNDGRSRSNIHQSRIDQPSAFLMANIQEFTGIMPEIEYQELTEATNNWDQKRKLGQGGFGTVFHGYWKHIDVAVKQIDYKGAAGGREGARVQLQQSLNELKHLYKFRHDNILPLYGYCIKGEKPCLVYQIMKGGSLDQRLNFKNQPQPWKPLTWQQRIDICIGTARGIYYLHSLCSDKPLIHGDIKPGNVLLDQCLQPKIGDFGLAMEGPNAINSAVKVSKVFGTRAYLPPEYLNSKRLSTQVDTYSFGVVLLETFTGLRVADKEGNFLTKTIRILLNNHKCEELIDKNMQITQPVEQMVCVRSIELGLACTDESPEERPEMENVLKYINSYYSGKYFMP